MEINSVLKNSAIKTILIQILSYFRYSQMIPMIILHGLLITMMIVCILILFTSYNIQFSIEHIPFLSQYKNSEIKIGIEEILKGYFYLSLIVYILGELSVHLFKVKIKLTFWKKILIILIVDFVGYGFVGAVFLWKFHNLEFLILMIILSVLTIILSIYSFTITEGINWVNRKIIFI